MFMKFQYFQHGPIKNFTQFKQFFGQYAQNVKLFPIKISAMSMAVNVSDLIIIFV